MFRSEEEFVGWLRRRLGRGGATVRLGVGDDAALGRIARANDLILTTDLSIEGVHFRRELHPARAVGHRALARALSDVAAMGGRPCFALFSLALSKRILRRWVEEFYAGAGALAERAGVAVVGGDTALVTGRTFVDVVVVGEIPRGRALLRSGARPGDQIFVSGWLGLSALGLRLLKSRHGGARGPSSEAIRAHLYPQPRLELGRFLREKRLASALMDLSDGLSTDLARLCQASSVGAELRAADIPRPRFSARERLAERSLDLALNGGEDYELLFTVRPGKVSQIPARFRGIPLRRIGEIRRSKGLELIHPNGKTLPIEPGGYDHFRKSSK